jgi:hypothetical protein
VTSTRRKESPCIFIEGKSSIFEMRALGWLPLITIWREESRLFFPQAEGDLHKK